MTDHTDGMSIENLNAFLAAEDETTCSVELDSAEEDTAEDMEDETVAVIKRPRRALSLLSNLGSETPRARCPQANCITDFVKF